MEEGELCIANYFYDRALYSKIRVDLVFLYLLKLGTDFFTLLLLGTWKNFSLFHPNTNVPETT